MAIQLEITATGQAQLLNPSRFHEVELGNGASPAEATWSARTDLVARYSPRKRYQISAPSNNYAFIEQLTDTSATLTLVDSNDEAFTPTEMIIRDDSGNALAYFANTSQDTIPAKLANTDYSLSVYVAYVEAQGANITFNAAAILPSTPTRRGIAQLATNAEALTGTDAAKIVTPAALNAALDARLVNIRAAQITSGSAPLANMRSDALAARALAGLSVTITPRSATSRILLEWSGGEAHITAGTSTDPAIGLFIVNGTAISAAEAGRVEYSRTGLTLSGASEPINMSGMAIHSPNSTARQTYSAVWYATGPAGSHGSFFRATTAKPMILKATEIA